MRRTIVVVVGAGQAGLAMSRCLHDRSVEHVVLDRADVAHSWRARRWDSLRLLTPNWMSRLPGYSYRGEDPDGFMHASAVADYLAAYRDSFAAPVVAGTEVTGLSRVASGWEVETTDGPWRSRAVVLATGEAGAARVPPLAAHLPRHLTQLTAGGYRNPGQLPEGGVLVVGAAASGVQLAEEIQRSGRPVTLCVGEHVRLPRRYRGRDIHRWLDTLGVLDERPADVEDLRRARRTPSPQLTGALQGRSLDLNALAGLGVRPVGRLVGYDGRRLQLSGSFANVCHAADLRMGRLLRRIDDHVTRHGLTGEVGSPDRPEPTDLTIPPTLLDATEVRSVVWATGHRPAYPQLDPALLDRWGGLRHDGGVLPAPGLYAVGLKFGRRRRSALLDGVGRDAFELAEELAGYLGAGHWAPGATGAAVVARAGTSRAVAAAGAA